MVELDFDLSFLLVTFNTLNTVTMSPWKAGIQMTSPHLIQLTF